MVAGLVLGGFKGFTRNRRRLDALDRVALAYIAIATAYLAVPSLFVLGSGISPPSSSVRLLAWRADTLFVFALLGARHAGIGPASRRTFIKAVLGAGTVAAGVGCYEAVATSSWNSFAVYQLGIPRYQNQILHVTSPLGMFNVEDKTTLAGHIVTRVGSVFFAPPPFGFYLVLILGVGIALAAQGRAGPRAYLAISLASVAVLATITRSCVISAALVLLIALRPQRLLKAHGHRSRRVRFVIVAGVGLLFLAPVVVATGVSQRTSASVSGGQDAGDHVSALVKGSKNLVARPLGNGIGTAPGVGNRYGVSGQVTAESAYLQVGDELGVPELVIFMAMLFLVVGRLRRAQRDDDDDSPLASGLFLAGLGLAVGGFFLHVWLDFSLAISFWGGAGLAIGVAEQQRHATQEQVTAVPQLSGRR
jgi:hypothetical protein